ncbi:MAG TPA: substrate-binding domain-containing protein [Tepidisphaeraceae bacterium]|nr:substrate-binding domain-containing protein [Tepidisphaeraceae bacterium]
MSEQHVPSSTPSGSATGGSTAAAHGAGTTRTGTTSGGGSTVRHFLIVFTVAVLAAVGIAWAAGAFRATPRVVLVTSTDDPYWDRVISGAQTAARQFNVELDVFKSKGDEKMQSQTIRDALSRNVAGIGVSPVDATAQADMLRDAAGRATLVTFDSDAPGSNRTAFIGTDNYIAGRQCAEVVREALPDGGELIISVGSVDKENGRLRRQGLIDNLAERPLDAGRAADPLDQPLKAGKYTIVSTLIDQTEPARATQLATEAIQKTPNLKLIVGLFGYSAPALLDALKQTNKLGQIKIVGFDEHEQTLAGIEQGHVAGTLVQDQFNMGYDTVRVLCEVINKVPPVDDRGRTQYLPCRAITSAEDVNIIRYEKQREQQQQPGGGGGGGAAAPAAASAQPSQPAPAAGAPATQPT